MKYMGSKSKIAHEILPIILQNRKENQYYVEPFCGGLNSLMHVSGKRIANDVNSFLIAMWKYLINNGLISLPHTISKDLYAEWRNYYNEEKRKHIKITEDNFMNYAMCGWIGFMASFNGRFYDGGYSGHNVKGRDYIGEQINNTVSQIEKLSNVEFYDCDYKELIIPSQSIIYCDIPYKNTKQYNLSINFNYEDFYSWCEKMKNEGHEIYISEYEMPTERFECIWQKEVTNALNPKITKKPIEKLFKVK